MRSGMLILPQAREALALRGGDRRRAGVHPYGGSGRGVVSQGMRLPTVPRAQEASQNIVGVL